MLVLVNRITPFELGLVGVVTIWNSFLGLFLELGLGAALVQRRKITDGHIASMMAINLITGTILTIISMALSWPLALLIGLQSAQPFIFILALGFFINSIATTQVALAQREMRFRDLAIRDAVAGSIATVLGVILAVKGFGVWSLVANTLTLNVLGMIMIWRLTPYRINLRAANISDAKELWNFGSSIFLYSIFKHILRNSDGLIIGALFGPEKLGIYNIAQQITFAPTRGIQAGITSFLFPKASRADGNERLLKSGYVVCYKALNYIVFFYGFLLITFGVTMLPKVIGSQWNQATNVVIILAVATFTFPAMAPLGEIMKAKGQPNWLLRWGIFFTSINAIALATGKMWGFFGAVAAYSASHFFAVIVALRVAKILMGLEFRELLSQTGHIYISLIFSLTLSAAVIALLKHSPFQLAAVLLVIILAEIVAIFYLDRDVRRYLAALSNIPIGKYIQQRFIAFKQNS